MPVRLMCSQLSGETCFNNMSGMFLTLSLQMSDSTVEIDGVPVHDGADDEIEPRSAECLALERPITDFAALVEEHGGLELVRCLAMLRPAWHRRRKPPAPDLDVASRRAEQR